MRKMMLALLVVCLTGFSLGCGGSPEEADTSHLDISNNPEAQEAAKAASEKYKNTGRRGPQEAPPSGN